MGNYSYGYGFIENKEEPYLKAKAGWAARFAEVMEKAGDTEWHEGILTIPDGFTRSDISEMLARKDVRLDALLEGSRIEIYDELGEREMDAVKGCFLLACGAYGLRYITVSDECIFVAAYIPIDKTDPVPDQKMIRHVMNKAVKIFNPDADIQFSHIGVYIE